MGFVVSDTMVGLKAGITVWFCVSEKKKEKKRDSATALPQAGTYIFPNGDKYGTLHRTSHVYVCVCVRMCCVL